MRPVPPAVAAGERVREKPKVVSGVENVGVEFSQRSDGVQMLRFIDRRTGVVISQTPPEQVLAVVDALVAAIQRKEA
ncbi:MAG TPA: hypothetical protein VFS16_15525 [Acidimicrobiia bacterium]|nr:hypothetical protein [Acidimicrobiia bacterium]